MLNTCFTNYCLDFVFTGIPSSDVQCDPDCDGHFEDDVFLTLRWFKHVLPKIRHKKVKCIKVNVFLLHPLKLSSLPI
jgi:hypothetical protein